MYMKKKNQACLRYIWQYKTQMWVYFQCSWNMVKPEKFPRNLLEKGISVDTVNNKKETPLLYSVKNLQAECLAMLLKSNAHGRYLIKPN